MEEMLGEAGEGETRHLKKKKKVGRRQVNRSSYETVEYFTGEINVSETELKKNNSPCLWIKDSLSYEVVVNCGGISIVQKLK